MSSKGASTTGTPARTKTAGSGVGGGDGVYVPVPELKKKTITLVGSVALLINNVTGGSMVVLPQTFQQAGWVLPVLALFGVATLSCICGLMLIEAMTLVPGNNRFQKRLEYTNIAHIYFPTPLYWTAQIFYQLSILAQNISMIVQSVQVMDFTLVALTGYSCAIPQLSPNFAFTCSYPGGYTTNGVSPFGDWYLISLGWLVTCAMVMPLGFIDLDDNDAVQKGGFAAVLSIVLVWCGLAISQPGNMSNVEHFGGRYDTLMGSVLFNFAIVYTIPSWANEKKPSVPIVKALGFSMAGAAVVFSLLGYCGGAGFPPPTNNQTLLNQVYALGSKISSVTFFLFPACVNLTTIPVNSIMQRYNLKEAGVCGSKQAAFWGVISPWLIAIPLYTGTGYQALVMWAGLVLNSSVNFIFPPIIYILAVRRYGTGPGAIRTLHEEAELTNREAKSSKDLARSQTARSSITGGGGGLGRSKTSRRSTLVAATQGIRAAQRMATTHKGGSIEMAPVVVAAAEAAIVAAGGSRESFIAVRDDPAAVAAIQVPSPPPEEDPDAVQTISSPSAAGVGGETMDERKEAVTETAASPSQSDAAATSVPATAGASGAAPGSESTRRLFQLSWKQGGSRSSPVKLVDADAPTANAAAAAAAADDAGPDAVTAMHPSEVQSEDGPPTPRRPSATADSILASPAFSSPLSVTASRTVKINLRSPSKVQSSPPQAAKPLDAAAGAAVLAEESADTVAAAPTTTTASASAGDKSPPLIDRQGTSSYAKPPAPPAYSDATAGGTDVPVPGGAASSNATASETTSPQTTHDRVLLATTTRPTTSGAGDNRSGRVTPEFIDPHDAVEGEEEHDSDDENGGVEESRLGQLGLASQIARAAEKEEARRQRTLRRLRKHRQRQAAAAANPEEASRASEIIQPLTSLTPPDWNTRPFKFALWLLLLPWHIVFFCTVPHSATSARFSRYWGLTLASILVWCTGMSFGITWSSAIFCHVSNIHPFVFGMFFIGFFIRWPNLLTELRSFRLGSGDLNRIFSNSVWQILICLPVPWLVHIFASDGLQPFMVYSGAQAIVALTMFLLSALLLVLFRSYEWYMLRPVAIACTAIVSLLFVMLILLDYNILLDLSTPTCAPTFPSPLN